eukprot:5222543-Prymnesium_polylepis.1
MLLILYRLHTTCLPWDVGSQRGPRAARGLEGQEVEPAPRSRRMLFISEVAEKAKANTIGLAGAAASFALRPHRHTSALVQWSRDRSPHWPLRSAAHTDCLDAESRCVARQPGTKWNPSSMTKTANIEIFRFAQEDNPNLGAKITRR